jgi:ABC-2 type transport system permease protein
MKLVRNYLSLHLKTSLEYRSSFIMTIISQSIAMLVELFTVITLFKKFRLLDEYNTYELLLGFSVLWLGFSLAEMFGRGYDNFSKIIVNGNFDILLVRPRSIYIQIFGSDLCYEKIGRVITTLCILIYSAIKITVGFDILKLLLLIFMVLGSTIVALSVFIIGASFTFITIQGLEVINIFTNGTRQLGQYPMGIYKKWIRIFFSIVIPITLVNYYPLEYLAGRTTNVMYVFMPLYSIVILIISIMIFNLGMKKYQSTGS